MILRQVAGLSLQRAAALLAVALVALASWPVNGTLRPRLDLDGAWQIALRQALHDGLDYGPDVLYTYGPLGFLREPMLVHAWSARLAFAWAVLVQFVLAATVIWGLRHTLRSRLAAVLLAIPIAAGARQEPTLVIAFVAAVALAAGRPRGRSAQALALGLGALSGIELLSKLNTGITVTALGVIALATAAPPRRPLVPAFALGTVGALAIGWAATGQALSGIGDYVRGGVGIISGYSQTLYYEDPATAWELWVAGTLIAVGAVVAWRAGEALPRRSRWGPLALWAVLAFTSFKTGFVRHDPGHADIFFSTLLGGIVAFGWAPHRRETALLVGALFAFGLIASGGGSPRSLFIPVTRAQNFADQARLLADGSKTNAGIAVARSERSVWEQFAGFGPVIGRRTVHVEPTDAGLVWSQRLSWHPLPVFQGYSAYTSDLDERNADEAGSPDGPDVIIREDTGKFESRNPVVEAPAAMRAILCHFRPAQAPIGRWLMLERSAPRCGPERPLKTIDAKLGVAAHVPPAPDRSSVVILRIEGIQVSGLEKLRSALYRADARQIAFEGGRVSRLPPGTAADGIVLRVPARADHPAPFKLDQASDTITVLKGDSQGDLRLRFSAMSIR